MTSPFKLKTHVILRSYIALARGEQFVVNRFTAEDAVVTQPRLAEVLLQVNERLTKQITESTGLTLNQIIDLGIIPQPHKALNIMICHELRRHFGLNAVASTRGFDGAGQFILPRFGKNILVPQRDEKKYITGLNIRRIAEVLKKR